jgi:hypothetical protein
LFDRTTLRVALLVGQIPPGQELWTVRVRWMDRRKSWASATEESTVENKPMNMRPKVVILIDREFIFTYLDSSDFSAQRAGRSINQGRCFDAVGTR